MKQYNIADEPNVIKRVSVRLIEETERARFDNLLEQKHYLCSAKMVGRSLRYVAELDGEWVALACFSASALHPLFPVSGRFSLRFQISQAQTLALLGPS